MSIKGRLFFVILSISLSCSSASDRQTDSARITSDNSLEGKSFEAIIKAAVPSLSEVAIQIIFHQDTTGLFLMGNGPASHEINFTWGFVGDSLAIREVYPSADSSTHQFNNSPTFYAVTQQPDGFILTGKREQMILKSLKTK